MVMRVQQVDGEYRVVLSPEAMAELNLTEGAEVELRPVMECLNSAVEVRHISVEEALKAYRETLPQHLEAYRELAK